MDIRDKVQIDAIKDREEYTECDKEIRKETYVRSRRCAYGRRREKDSRGNGCRRKCNRDH